MAKFLKQKGHFPEELIKAIETISITDEYTGQIATDVLSDEISDDFFQVLSLLVRNFDLTQTFISYYLESEDSRIFKWIKSIAIANID